MIVFEHVTKRYGPTVAVNDLSFEIPSGEIVVLAGPSGCGKTTSLKMINRLIEPSDGVISVEGRDTRHVDATALRRSIGYVIQQGGLFPHRTIAENVATVPKLLGWDHRRIRARTTEMLDLVGLPAKDFADRMPSQLSGGQKQRVGVARALAADPPVLLMDEPFAALDPVTRGHLQDELLRLQGVVRKTIVFVTHDIDEAIKLADRIAIFQQGGVLVQYAAPATLLAQPATPFVDDFLGSGRMVRRLGLIPLRQAAMAPANGATPTTSVDAGGTLRDALDAVLRAADGRAVVTDGDRVLGVIDADLIREAAPVMRAAGVLSRGRVLLTPVLTLGALALLLLYVSSIPARLGDDQILSRAFLESRLRQHLEIVAIAFALAAAIAVPLGIVLAGAGRFWQQPVFALANLGQAMPGVALLAIAFTVVGLGLRTTVFALVIYALLPILRNTVVGMHSVDPAVVEAARGMGMTRLQTLLRVQLPLIEPALFAGLRTALVLIVGTATLGNFIGGGGLGDVIAAGIGAGRDRIVLTGAGIVAALALLADWALGLVEALLTPET